MIIMLFSAVFLAACSKHKDTSNEGTTSVLPNTEKNINKPVVLEPIQRSTNNTTPIPSGFPQSNPSTIGSLDVLPTNETTISEIDLITRIKRGFSLPNITSPHTSQYIEWSIEHPSYLHDLFTRATPFLYYIVEEIEKRGMPTEIALLPAIESAFKPNALSKSNASGLWQFVPSTGQDFGLHQTWWFDGRRDPIKATNAALDYLTQLNKLFEGDWHLTLAAYNAGQGTVLRAISSNKLKGLGTRYQDLALRSETVRYVPKLQAIKNIVNNPIQYGVDLITIPNQPHFEIVTIPGQIYQTTLRTPSHLVKSKQNLELSTNNI